MIIYQGQVEYVSNGISHVHLELLGSEDESDWHSATIESHMLEDSLEDIYFSVEIKGDAINIVPPWRRNQTKEESQKITDELDNIFGKIER